MSDPASTPAEVCAELVALSPRPGDLLVLTLPPEAGAEDAMRATGWLRSVVPIEVGVLVLPHDARIEHFTPEQLAAVLGKPEVTH